MSVALPGLAIFVGGTLCSTVYNRGGSEVFPDDRLKLGLKARAS